MHRGHRNSESDRIPGDRRRNLRFGLRLSMRWKLIPYRRVGAQGTGRTLDLSSGGVLFETDSQLPAGAQWRVELFITWPVLLHGTTPLQLTISGRIIRSEDNRVAVQIARFRVSHPGHRGGTTHSAGRHTAQRLPADFNHALGTGQEKLR